MAQQMTGAEMVVEALKDQGVEHIFGYPGGAVLPIYDAIFQQDKVRHILVRHEQGATHMAEGYARSTGKCGVVLVTSGPGATNAVTGLTDACSIPSAGVHHRTGPVPLIGSDAFRSAIRSGSRAAAPSTIISSNRSRPAAHPARSVPHRASGARAGMIDIPKDVQFAMGTYIKPQANEPPTYKPQREGDIEAIRVAWT